MTRLDALTSTESDLHRLLTQSRSGIKRLQEHEFLEADDALAEAIAAMSGA